MSDKQVLVTGGAGFIGSHTVVALHEAGFTPVILDNFVNSERFIVDRLCELTEKRIELIDCDCSKFEKLLQELQGRSFVGAIHFAAYKAVGESVEKPLDYYRNNIESLNALLQLGPEITGPIVFSSSCTVYGQPKELPVSEQAPTVLPESPYGRTKLMCEQVLKDTIPVQNGKAALLRYFNPIGAHPSAKIGELPRGVPNNLVPFITQAAAGLRTKLTVFGDDYETPDGSCIRDYLHVMDLAEAHVAALNWLLNQPAGTLDTFNLGTGTGSSVLEVLNAFEKATGEKVPYEIGPRREGDVEQVWAQADKAKEVLGWQTARSLEDSLTDAWHWQKKALN